MGYCPTHGEYRGPGCSHCALARLDQGTTTRLRDRIAALEAEVAALRERVTLATEYRTPDGYDITSNDDDMGGGWVIYGHESPVEWLGHDGKWHVCYYKQHRDSHPTADAAFSALAAWQAREGEE